MADAFTTYKVVNRTDETVEVIYDQRPITFEPRAARWLPEAVARHCEVRTMVRLHPYDTSQFTSKLAIVEEGTADPAALSADELARKELIDRDLLPGDAHTDPETGEPLRAELKHVNADPRDLRATNPRPLDPTPGWRERMDANADLAADAAARATDVVEAA